MINLLNRALPFLIVFATFCPMIVAQTPEDIATTLVLQCKQSGVSGYPQLNFSILLADNSYAAFYDISQVYGSSAGATYHTSNNPTEQQACSGIVQPDAKASCQFYGAKGTTAYYFTGHFSGIVYPQTQQYFYQPSTSNTVICVPGP